MAILQVVTGEDQKILRTKIKAVERITKKTIGMISSMKETMLASNGVGLAAPQIDLDARIIVCRFDAGKKNEKIVAMINPEILMFSEDKAIDEEGCLSLPKIFGNVSRSKSIQVKFQNEKGKEQVLEFSGFNARIVQHEVDHLNGILFTDYLD